MTVDVVGALVFLATCLVAWAFFVGYLVGWVYSDHREKNRVLRKFEVFRRIQDAKINELKTKIAEQEVELGVLKRETGEKE